jgi:FMN phosphatase YigB (HAD superfamily)
MGRGDAVEPGDAVSDAAWLVDLDGTLYRARPVQLAMTCELALGGWSAIPILRAFRHEHERLRTELVDTGRDPFGLQVERTATALGCPADRVEHVVRVWMIRRPGRWLRAFRRRDLLREIAAFRRGGGRTALVSDYPATEKLGALGALDLFDAVVSVGEPGGPRRLKPWPDGLLRAAELLGLSPEDCRVLGDRADADGEAARRAGMRFRPVGRAARRVPG